MDEFSVNTTNIHRRQLQTGKGVGEDSYNGMVDCFRKIIKNEGYADCLQKWSHELTRRLAHRDYTAASLRQL
jgi:hypothetical protein